MNKLHYFFLAIASLFLASCSSDDVTAEDWVGSYTGTLTQTEKILMTGETETFEAEVTIVITAGADDETIIMTLVGEGTTLKIDGDKADLSNLNDEDYTDSEGELVRDGATITLDWKGTYLDDGEPYSEDTASGTFTKQ